MKLFMFQEMFLFGQQINLAFLPPLLSKPLLFLVWEMAFQSPVQSRNGLPQRLYKAHFFPQQVKLSVHKVSQPFRSAWSTSQTGMLSLSGTRTQDLQPLFSLS